MNSKKIVSIVTIVIFAGVLAYILYVGKTIVGKDQDFSLVSNIPQSPYNASFQIEDTEVQLQEGKTTFTGEEGDVAVEVVQDPVYGDMNGDSVDDALLLMRYTKDSAPSLYYVALALAVPDGYLGMNAVPLHVESVPQVLYVQDEVLMVAHTVPERSDAEKDVQQTEMFEYITLVGTTLRSVGPLEEHDIIERGFLTYTTTAKIFTTCAGLQYHIAPDSQARAALEAIFLERTRYSGIEDNKVYVVLAGHTSDSPGIVAEEATEGSDDLPEVFESENVEEQSEEESLDFISGSVFTVRTILSAPKQGDCTHFQKEPLVETTEVEPEEVQE
jgi:hypothetical protein